MRSLTNLTNFYTSLSTNTSTDNQTLGKQLINDQHRYLLQKYFDNERSFQTTTVGGMSLTLTGSLTIGAVSATLTVAWAYPTNSQLVNFSDGEQRTAIFTLNSTAITWIGGLTVAVTSAITTVGYGAYNIPAIISKIKDNTINIGQLKYTPIEISTRQDWDRVTFLPYTSDIPQYVFIYNGQLNIWPTPSTTGNIVTFNYKTRVADLTFADYSTGNIDTAGMVSGSTTVTGLSTNWNSSAGFPLTSVIDYYNLMIRANPPYGDGIWYPIYKFNSNTSLTLSLPVVNAPNITSSTTYTIGQFPILTEDFQDMLVYGSLMIYFSSIVKDKDQYAKFEKEYNKRLELLSEYAGTRSSINVDLGDDPQMTNPNLFPFANTSS